MESINPNIIRSGPHHTNMRGEALRQYLVMQGRMMIPEFELAAEQIAARFDEGNVLVIGTSGINLAPILEDKSDGLIVHCMDANPETVALARECGPHLRYTQWTEHGVPFRERSFVCVVSLWELHHWGHPAAVLAMSSEVLVKGGIVTFFDLYRDCPPEALEKFTSANEQLRERMRAHLATTLEKDAILTLFNECDRFARVEAHDKGNFLQVTGTVSTDSR